MGARATQIKSSNGHAVSGKSTNRARRKELIECHGAMEDIAIRQAKNALQIQRGQALSGDHARLETWRIRFDGIEHQIGHSLTMLVPGRAVRKLRAYMLTEEARHMRARRRQAIVDRRWDHQFNNRHPAPTICDAITVGLVHV